jgi:two-component system chemotaxis response regulator CheB
VEQLPPNLPAALFVTIHTGADTPGVLAQILQRRSRLTAKRAIDGEPIRHGTIYCPTPDHHLLLERGHVRVFPGPRENGFRPAIDPLFRSASAAYSTRVLGVVLSGALDDGVHGLMKIKHRGGVAIVQSPEEAVVDALPLNAIRHVEVDHIAGAKEIANLLVRLAHQEAPKEIHTVDDQEIIEATVVDGVNNILQSTKPGHAPSAFTCPDCGGSLWELQNGQLTRFRCHVGHVYTADSLVVEKDAALENVMWSALRALEESIALRHRMAARARAGNVSSIAENFERRAREDEARAEVLRRFLLPEEVKSERSSKRSKTAKNGGRRAGRKTKSRKRGG